MEQKFFTVNVSRQTAHTVKPGSKTHATIAAAWKGQPFNMRIGGEVHRIFNHAGDAGRWLVFLQLDAPQT